MNKHRHSKKGFVKSSKRKSIISISKKTKQRVNVEKNVREISKEWIYFQLILAFLLSLTAGILSLKIGTDKPDQSGELTEKPGFENESANPMVPNLVVVYDQGAVMKITFDKTFQIIKTQKLLQIPKSKSYFAYSYKGLLYLAYDKLSRKMTKYHPALSKSGFRLVENSGMDPEIHDWESNESVNHVVQCGAKNWFLGKVYYYQLAFVDTTMHDSYIWYQKRQKWKKGPKIQPQFYGIFCACAINRTSVMVMERKNDPFDWPIFAESILSVFVYDFDSARWTTYPDLPSKSTYDFANSCTAISVHDKSAKR